MPSVRLTCPLVATLASGLIAAPAPGHPPAPVDERGRALAGKLHTWMHDAQVPLVRGRVRVLRSACPGEPSFAGCLFAARPRTLYLRRDIRDPRGSFYHELGHGFDLLVLNNRERREFKRIVGIRRRGWFHGDLPPVEWFADGYAECARRGPSIRRRLQPTPYGYAPSRRQHTDICRLILRAAAPRSRPPQPPSNPPPVIEAAPPPREEIEADPGSGCTLVDQLLTGCEPPPAPAPPLPG
jgi:hypothetical protein